MKRRELPNSPLQAIERLSLLTLALESALVGGRFEETDPLFAEREQCIDALESMALDAESKAKLDRILKVDQRIMTMLADLRNNIAGELSKGALGRDANKRYAGLQDRTSSFDQAG